MPDFVVPPSFVGISRYSPLWANQTICLTPVTGATGEVYSWQSHFLLAASEPFSQVIDDGLFTSRPLSERYQHCYSSLQCFYSIQLETYRGIYNIGPALLSSAFSFPARAMQKSLVSAPTPLRGQRRCALCTSAFRLSVVWASEARPNYTQTPQWLRRRRKATDLWTSW